MYSDKNHKQADNCEIFTSVWLLIHYLSYIQYSNKNMYPYGSKCKELCSPLDYWMCEDFMIVHFRHPLEKELAKTLMVSIFIV